MSEIVKRADASVENTWKLEDLFPDRKAWDQEYEEVKQLAKKATQFQGKLNSAEAIVNCFKLEDELSLKTERVYVYAHLHHDEDTAEPTYQGLSQKAKKLGVEVSESLSFVTPEILALPDNQLDALIKDPKLADYRFTLQE
ncbi:oligoendopeptidase F, partial [Paenibacillus sp. 28ISP30-2]|nr:oligoendopeptidase F [Paenibacillus sp. 28ISP30-2]